MSATQLELYWKRRAEEAEKQIDNFLTYGQGGASFEESQWIDRLYEKDMEIERLQADLEDQSAKAHTACERMIQFDKERNDMKSEIARLQGEAVAMQAQTVLLLQHISEITEYSGDLSRYLNNMPKTAVVDRLNKALSVSLQAFQNFLPTGDTAISSTAGAELLEYVKKLEKVVEAALELDSTNMWIQDNYSGSSELSYKWKQKYNSLIDSLIDLKKCETEEK